MHFILLTSAMKPCTATGGFKSLRSHVQATKDSVNESWGRLISNADPEDDTNLEEV
jgi:hypothetical protein